MKMESVCNAHFVNQPELDYQQAEEIGCFRFGAEAVYIPGFPEIRYLPLAALQRVWVQESTLAVGGSRGTEIRLYVLRAQYGNGPWQNFTFSRRGRCTERAGTDAQAEPGASRRAGAGAVTSDRKSHGEIFPVTFLTEQMSIVHRI